MLILAVVAVLTADVYDTIAATFSALIARALPAAIL